MHWPKKKITTYSCIQPKTSFLCVCLCLFFFFEIFEMIIKRQKSVSTFFYGLLSGSFQCLNVNLSICREFTLKFMCWKWFQWFRDLVKFINQKKITHSNFFLLSYRIVFVYIWMRMYQSVDKFYSQSFFFVWIIFGMRVYFGFEI